MLNQSIIYDEPEEGTLEFIMMDLNLDIDRNSNWMRRIQRDCTDQLSQIDEVAGRISPRTVAKLDPKSSSELVSSLLDCVGNLRQYLQTEILEPKSTFSEILAVNERLKLSFDSIQSHDTIVNNNKVLSKTYTSVLEMTTKVCDKVNPVLDRVSSLEQKLTAFNQNHDDQLTELKELTTEISKPPKPLDWSQITFPPLPKLPAIPASPPVLHPTPLNIRKEVKRSAEELERRNNIMIYGLAPVDNCTAHSCVTTMFKNCSIETFSTLSGHIESAQYLIRDKEKSVIRVVMSNRFKVDEILAEARQLKHGQYSSVYIGRDRTKEEREQHKLRVNTLKQKIKDCPDRTWAIVRGVIVDKGPYTFKK